MPEGFDAQGAARAIARAFLESRQIARLAEGYRPASLADSYQVQDQVVTRLGPIGGWKVGRNPTDGLDTCAPLFQSRIFTEKRVPSPMALLGTGLEIEFAARIGTDLPGRDRPYEVDDVRGAIEAFVPLVELVGGRFLDRSGLTPAEQLADGYGAGVVIGTPAADWRTIDFCSLDAELWIDGVQYQRARDVHPAGDPLILIAWLANHLSRRAAFGGLRRGQIVTTGGLAGVTPVRGGERVEARYRSGDRWTTLRFDFDH